MKHRGTNWRISQAYGEGPVTATTIAMHERDDRRLKAIANDFQHSAEKFYTAMQNEDAGEDPDLEDSDETDHEAGQDNPEDAASSAQAQEETGVGVAYKRTSVWKWVLVSDHMLWSALGGGWSLFMIPRARDRQKQPEDWPSLTMSLDQGGDGWSAGDFGQPLDVNKAEVPFDFSNTRLN